VQIIAGQDVVGTGVVFDAAGHIVTNAQFVGNGAHLGVGVFGLAGAQPATLVGTYQSDDLAVLKLDKPTAQLKPMAFADSAKALIGQPVVVTGFPSGSNGSVTTGVVSGIARTVTQANSYGGATIPNLLQTSAAVNSGNIGGALLDDTGKMLGMPVPSSPAVEPGLGYALPVARISDLATQLIKNGRVTTSHRSTLGVGVLNATSHGAPAGAEVVSVDPGSPAAAAGIRPGEVISKIGPLTITSAVSLRNVLANSEPGQTMPVVLLNKDGHTRTTTLTLGALLQ
jgi:S1-C subfamily serine protease